MSLKNSFKLRSQAEIDKEANEKAERQKREKWLEIEKNRTEREKYEIAPMSGWFYLGPFLGMVLAALCLLVMWLGEADSLLWLAVVCISPLIFMGFASEAEDDWKYSLEIKKDLDKDKGVYIKNQFSGLDNLFIANEQEYKHGFIYTDSYFKFVLSKLSKIIAVFSTILFLIGLVILLFVWLGTVSIAPSTIIIILLIMILFKK